MTAELNIDAIDIAFISRDFTPSAPCRETCRKEAADSQEGRRARRFFLIAASSNIYFRLSTTYYFSFLSGADIMQAILGCRIEHSDAGRRPQICRY